MGFVNDNAIVSTHSRLKAAGTEITAAKELITVSTHSRLKAAGFNNRRRSKSCSVSTHSRLKAAGPPMRYF